MYTTANRPIFDLKNANASDAKLMLQPVQSVPFANPKGPYTPSNSQETKSNQHYQYAKCSCTNSAQGEYEHKIHKAKVWRCLLQLKEKQWSLNGGIK